MRAVVLIVLACGMAGLALEGRGALGRVLLGLGQPGLAAMVFDKADWRGVALFEAGAPAQAAEAFAEAGDYFNLGTAQAFAGNYAASLEAYDIAIAQGHPRAQANFDVVAAFYAGMGIDPEALGLFPERKDGPTEDSFIAQGNARAAGTGDEVTNSNTMLGLAQLDSRGKLGVRRVFDDQFMVADKRWLVQLEDVPGAFMAERISQEYKRRVKLGLAPPKPEHPR